MLIPGSYAEFLRDVVSGGGNYIFLRGKASISFFNIAVGMASICRVRDATLVSKRYSRSEDHSSIFANMNVWILF